VLCSCELLPLSRPLSFRVSSPHLSGLLIHARQIDSGDELDRRWEVGILVPAMDVDAVDAVLVHALQWRSSVSLGLGRHARI
jgi:hypothetical protein